MRGGRFSAYDDSGLCNNAPGDELKQLFYKQHDANFWGAEGQGDVPLAKTDGGALSGEFQADFVRAIFTGNLGNVPLIPPYRLGAGLNWDSDPITAGFMFYYDGRQTEIAQLGETPTKSYVSLDTNIAWRPFSSRKVEFAIIGHNLTDAVQRDAVSINKDAIVLPGRNVRFVLRVPF